ncbi:MAG: helix-hairpin-helix domain-containing protein [Dorea sp.]|nr:helix-hairpin-helix domain-containing protein [Dorea sp.]
MNQDKKTREKYKKREILRSVSIMVLTLSVILSTAACSRSRTGGAHTFTQLSVEDSEEKGPEEKDLEEKDSEVKDSKEKNSETEDQIYVHVCGAVEKPGVYELAGESRIYQAIDAAGGLTKDADEAAVNQAGRVEDGQQIYVYTKEETKNSRENGNLESGQKTMEADQSASKVNLNTAGKEELKTLTGIGEAKAQAIIDFRESNGAYTSIEDIMKIEGIKQGVFNKIKEDITI